MRFDYINDKYIVYLKDIFETDINSFCENLINMLNNNFNLDIKGFVNIDIYIDKRYGTILEIVNDYEEMYSDFKRLDLNINLNNTCFLYKIIDIFSFNINRFYIYDHEFYIDLEDVNNKNLEFCQLIYKNCENIIKDSKFVTL